MNTFGFRFLCYGLFVAMLSVILFTGCAAANCTTCNTCPNTAGMAGYN